MGSELGLRSHTGHTRLHVCDLWQAASLVLASVSAAGGRGVILLPPLWSLSQSHQNLVRCRGPASGTPWCPVRTVLGRTLRISWWMSLLPVSCVWSAYVCVRVCVWVGEGALPVRALLWEGSHALPSLLQEPPLCQSHQAASSGGPGRCGSGLVLPTTGAQPFQGGRGCLGAGKTLLWRLHYGPAFRYNPGQGPEERSRPLTWPQLTLVCRQRPILPAGPPAPRGLGCLREQGKCSSVRTGQRLARDTGVECVRRGRLL